MNQSPSAARKPLAAAILAAGESRRMGTPKALLPYHGRTFAEYLLAVTNHPRVGLKRIVVGAHSEEIRSKLGAAAENIVVNQDWQLGQLSSIQAAIRSLPSGGTAGLLLCPVDHPLVTAELIARLIDEFDATGKQIVLPTFRGKRGHPLIFAASLYPELLAASPKVGARQVVWAHTADIFELPTDEEGVVLNLNDPETFRRAVEAS
jgi:molybdenum cofactor cytidylyltransferase